MTLAGTNTYLVGSDPAYVIDPGPADAGHVEAVLRAGDRRGGIGGVLLTHSHADHSAAVDALEAPLLWGTVSDVDETAASAGGAAWGSSARRPQAQGTEDARGGNAGTGPPVTDVGPFAVIPTPGHAADHACFQRDDVVFCGDLVLGEGSTIVPSRAHGGSLADYMRSLERLRNLRPRLLCPGHGPWITDPDTRISAYVDHRSEREAKLVAALEGGERSRSALLDAVWDDVPEPLRGAAAVAMEAHLEKLEAEGRLAASLEP